ncbi:MAG: flavin reductase family protein [Marinilabiliales bacterium]|nr:MAG: flavin reductase family protein [Marinilabiliales bacterium]
MNMKTSFGPQKLMFPCPTGLVVMGTMEKANIVTIAWISLLTSSPPTIGISVGTRGFSGNEIKKNGEFTVNIASVDIMVEADFCGITSGRDTDKFDITGLTKMESKIVKPPIIKECPLNLECVLVESGIFGSTNHFAGKIVETHIDTDKLEDSGDYTTFDIAAINPLIYIGGAREYRQIGKKTGDAYQVGKKLFR